LRRELRSVWITDSVRERGSTVGELVSVYILDIPYHADKAYTYYLPEQIAASCLPGCLVEVPFGRGNRRMTAIVTDLPEGSADPSYKPVFSLLSEPLLNAEMLGVCRFLKEHTLCTFGEAVRAAVPGAALSRIVEYFQVLTPEAEEYPVQYDDRTVAVHRFCIEKKKLTRQQIQNEFSFDCTYPIQQLLRDGYLEKQSVTRGADSGRVRVIVSMSAVAAEKQREQGLNSLTGTLRSENQKKMLELLSREESTSMEEKELYEACGVSVSTGRGCLKRLAGLGLLFTMEVEEFRDPFRMPEGMELSPPPVLTEEQQAAYEKIASLYSSGEPKAVLLHGVTGSGKTSVMLAAISRVLEDGRGVILLVPEIALTPQTVGIYQQRFGKRIAVIHSGLSAGERLDAWRRIREGLADVVIGTRSAIFAPLPRLGMILIDEEHEYTYKSDTSPKYHAHDVARFRCREHKAMMLLSSATPSVVSYHKAKKGTYTLVELKKRYNRAPLPQVEICDMRGTPMTEPVGEVLAARLRADKAEGNQSILFLNRRGYNHFVSCRSCGKSIQCPHCSVSMTYHTVRRGRLHSEDPEDYQRVRRENGILACHMCGYRSPVPELCPVCGQPHFLFMGCGTQKAEDDIETMFPDLRVIRMDTDTTQGKFSHEALLNRFRAGEADVLLGTQMVTKGHDFPKVATVGVLNADGSLLVDDYRANERTFSMLTQVIGRAGRGDVAGRAIIQTRNPDSEVLHLAAAQDYPRFFDGEIRLRKALCFPPFCDIAVITISGSDEEVLASMTASLQLRFRQYAAVEFRDVPMQMFGPFEAPVYRVQNIFRMRFVIKCRLNKRSRAMLDRLLCEYGSGVLQKMELTTRAKKPTGDTHVPLNTRGDRRVSITVDLNPSTI